MIQTIKYEQLPQTVQLELRNVYYLKIDWIPLRELQQKTGLSINTLRKLRATKEASYTTWQKLIKGLSK